MAYAVPPVTTRQVSVSEASRELNVSPETVRRWIKSGRLEARRAIRPQGTAWEISLPVTTSRGVPPVIAVTSEPAPADQGEAHASADEALHPSPPATRHTDSSAALVASIARLIADLAEVRTLSDRRADQLISMAETIGRQSERVANLELENGRLMAQVFLLTPPPSPVEAPGATAGPAPATDVPTPWWRFWERW